MLWLACMYHILELIVEAAITLKLGAISGPMEPIYSRFEKYFDALTEEELEEVMREVPDRTLFLSPED